MTTTTTAALNGHAPQQMAAAERDKLIRQLAEYYLQLDAAETTAAPDRREPSRGGLLERIEAIEKQVRFLAGSADDAEWASIGLWDVRDIHATLLKRLCVAVFGTDCIPCIARMVTDPAPVLIDGGPTFEVERAMEEHTCDGRA